MRRHPLPIRLAATLVLALGLASAGCEDDPQDLDFLKSMNAGSGGSPGSGGGAPDGGSTSDDAG